MHVKSAERLISYDNKTAVSGWDGWLPEEMVFLRMEAHNCFSQLVYYSLSIQWPCHLLFQHWPGVFFFV